MNIEQRFFFGDEFEFLADSRRKGFGKVALGFCKKLLKKFDHYPVGHALICEFLGGRIYGLHGGTEAFFVIGLQFHLGVWHGKYAVHPVTTTENNIGYVFF